ncbi:MAG: phosphopantetheine-binding protein [Betaproteobacteria bacterium]|nr:phosphopantetheine-binding protein [Betaproteobacteria bacterium]
MLEKIIEFIRERKELNDIEITGESQLVRDLGLTSFDLVTMVCWMEEEFGRIINDDMMIRSITVNDIVHCLKQRQS